MEVLEVAENLQLIPIIEAHATDLYKVVDKNRTYLRQWLPWLDQQKSTLDSQAFARAAHQRNAGGEGFIQVIFYQGRLCGVSGYNFIDHSNRWGEIGYWIDQQHQGKGIVTRSVAAQVTHGFTRLNLNRISISVATGNSASRAVPERLGFSFEGILRESEWLYDGYVDHALYARLKSDPPPSSGLHAEHADNALNTDTNTVPQPSS